MAGSIERAARLTGSPACGFAVALAIPIALTYLTTWLSLPPFVFEHLVVLLVVAVAVPWGLGPAITMALVSVAADNILLREPIGRPTISGYRDILDLALFATVAIVVSELVRRAHAARLVAQAAAERERLAREDRDRLIATVTHDLATPLSVLTGTVRFARSRGLGSEDDVSRLLARLETASARASSLVRTLADAQAIESDGLDLNVRAHDIGLWVRPIVEMMDRLSERHPVMLAMPEAPVIVMGDADRLQRVLENLVSNAIKYSPEGGTVEVSVRQEDGEAAIRVRDHGIGISPEALPRIFDRSYRAPEAPAYAAGLGLGLSIAAEVIARHGGTIEAAPADRCGTEVVVRLPVASRGGELAAAVRAGGRPLRT